VVVHEVEDIAQRLWEGAFRAFAGRPFLVEGWVIYKLAVGWLLCEAVRKHHRDTGLDIVEAAEYEALGLPLMLRPERRCR